MQGLFDRFVEDVIRTYRQEKGLEGSWLTRNILRNDFLVRNLFNFIPFLTFLLIGMIFTLTWSYLIKLSTILIYCLVTFYVGKWLHFARFSDQFSLAVYLGCKACILTTIFTIWVPATATVWSVITWVLLICGLWYNFLRTWLGDPGFISPPKEDKLKAVVELAEKDEFNVMKLCTTCLVVRPLRSKHCSICKKCVEVMDHHCPFTGNCIGKKNHRFFVGYLILLSFCGIFVVHTGFLYVGEICGLSSQNFLLTIGPTLECAPWSMFVLCFSFASTVWISFLTCMQVYQISMMAMTTNERLNQHRYGHFHGEGGLKVNPFDRGCLLNCMDFSEIECFGLRRRLRSQHDYQPVSTETV